MIVLVLYQKKKNSVLWNAELDHYKVNEVAKLSLPSSQSLIPGVWVLIWLYIHFLMCHFTFSICVVVRYFITRLCCIFVVTESLFMIRYKTCSYPEFIGDQKQMQYRDPLVSISHYINGEQ